MTESAQSIAKRILGDLDALISQGRLDPSQVSPLRSDLDPIANPPAPPIIARRPPSSQAQRKRYKAIWAYNGTQADELTFVEGDRIELAGEISEGWWKGSVIRPDNSKSNEGLFPSNYVEIIADDVLTASSSISPPLPPRFTAPISASNVRPHSEDEKQAEGWQSGPYNHTPWQPGVARWSSGAPTQHHPPYPGSGPAPPSPAPSNNTYYQQPPMPYGPNTPNAFGPGPSVNNSVSALQPVPVTEEDKKKHDKLKKIGGRLGERMAGGFAGGLGFGIGMDLINKI